MAIYVETSDPQALLENIIKSIKNQDIKTWSVDDDGDLTHISQWKNKAWFTPIFNGKKELVFGLIGRKDETMSKIIYGIYHGRFSEMLLTHFDSLVESIQITSQGIKEIDYF